MPSSSFKDLRYVAAALLCVFSLVASKITECVGWQSSPAARMACCEDDSCPMHRDHSGSSSMTQAQADSCCAVSERHDPGQPPSSVASTPSLVALTGPVEKIAPARIDPSALWQPQSSLRLRSTPTHLLDSVLLV